MPELLDLAASGRSARDFDWSLESLFEDRKGNRELLPSFASAFRQALQRWDYGFPFHTWLLAQLPWTLIVTTNFDGFHERAAASAAATCPEPTDRIRRLGDMLRPRSRVPAIEKLVEGSGLFKPYGSLMTMGPLALSELAFWERVRAIEGCFKKILKPPKKGGSWVVIAGHQLASSAIVQNLMRLTLEPEKKGAIRLVWVDPRACSLAQQRGEAFIRQFYRTMEDGLDAIPAGGQFFAPLPARAIDFTYDLWQEYTRLRG